MILNVVSSEPQATIKGVSLQQDPRLHGDWWIKSWCFLKYPNESSLPLILCIHINQAGLNEALPYHSQCRGGPWGLLQGQVFRACLRNENASERHSLPSCSKQTEQPHCVQQVMWVLTGNYYGGINKGTTLQGSTGLHYVLLEQFKWITSLFPTIK